MLCLKIVQRLFGFHLFQEYRVAGRLRHERGVAFRIAAIVLADLVGGGVQELLDPRRLPLKHLPKNNVGRFFRRIGGDFDLEPIWVTLIKRIALPDNAAFALFHVGRAPWRVDVVKPDKPFLGVHARAHLEGGSDQDTNAAGIHVLEKPRLLIGGVIVVDKGDFGLGHPVFNEIGAHVVIE